MRLENKVDSLISDHFPLECWITIVYFVIIGSPDVAEGKSVQGAYEIFALHKVFRFFGCTVCKNFSIGLVNVE